MSSLSDHKVLERRRSSRQAVSLGALAQPRDGRSWLCAIRDVSAHGLLLANASGGRSLRLQGTTPEVGDTLSLHFSVPSAQGSRHFRMQGEIARLTHNGKGVGVTFRDGLPTAAHEALLVFAGALPAASAARDGAVATPVAQGALGGLVNAESGDDAESGIPLILLREGRLSDQAVNRVRALVRPLLRDMLETVCDHFRDGAARSLLVSAREANSSALHELYLAGFDALDRHGRLVTEAFFAAVIAQFDAVSPLEVVLEQRRRRETGAGGELSLVDAEQFEDWLAVAEVIARLEATYADILLELRARFGLMARPWAHKDAMPVGPAALAWAFADALREPLPRQRLRLDTYRYFEEVLLEHLGAFYERLGGVLEGTGLFPPATELRERLRQRQVIRSAAGSRSPRMRSRHDDWRSQVRWQDDLPARTAAGTANASSTLRAARRLVQIERQHHARPGGAGEGRSETTLTRAEVLEALSILEREVGAAPPAGVRLKPRLMQILRERHGEDSRLEPAGLDDLNEVERLVDALEADRYISRDARGWIQRLELTLNKLAARDRAFLDQAEDGLPHGALRLLNQLARLGDRLDPGDAADHALSSRVEALLDRVIQEFDANPDVIETVVDELNPLLDRQDRAWQANLERTARVSSGRQQLARARRAVVDALAPRLAGRDVPELALRLLNPGWRNLLVHTHLREGPESDAWQARLAEFAQVAGQLDGSLQSHDPGFLAPEQILRQIVAGLNGIAFDPGQRTPLVMALSAALIGDATGRRDPVRYVSVAADGVIPALGFDAADVAPPASDSSGFGAGDREAKDPDAERGTDGPDTAWLEAAARVRRVGIGEWIATTDARGRPQILAVAFVGDDATSFVLVNRKGIKVREYSRQDFVRDLREGRVTLLEDFDLPLVERASQRMLETLHQRLAYQASHDALTGLVNRREFERLVGGAVETARQQGLPHAVLYVDLDQFKIVNNTSGHTAGDALLTQVGERLQAEFGAERVHVARLGGDEFGLLALDCAPGAARTLAQQVGKIIRGQRFTWNERDYILSASIGLVLLDRQTVSVDRVMHHADAACYAAKDAGRDRVQEFTPSDPRVSQRQGGMESVTLLDAALAENRLVLNCQVIVPVSGGRPVHHEVLLTMPDGSGQLIPPGEFILAAETYQRSMTLDRWVIRRVLGWMAEHASHPGGLPSLAINISGQSVGDESFAAFVLQELASSGVPADRVCFEITETAAIANLERAREFMHRLQGAGCRFSLDDFGAGLASYSHLRNLPVDYVKIDGAFVRAIADNPDDLAVVRSINEIGHHLGKETIAESVESAEVLARLQEIGVDYVQGYHTGKPIPLDSLLG